MLLCYFWQDFNNLMLHLQIQTIFDASNNKKVNKVHGELCV